MIVAWCPFVEATAYRELFPPVFGEERSGPTIRFLGDSIAVPVDQFGGGVCPLKPAAIILQQGTGVGVCVEGVFNFSSDSVTFNGEHDSRGWVERNDGS